MARDLTALLNDAIDPPSVDNPLIAVAPPEADTRRDPRAPLGVLIALVLSSLLWIGLALAFFSRGG